MGQFQNLQVGTITLVGDKASSAGPQIIQRDASGNATRVFGTSVPANGGSGYAIGCLYRKSDAALGQCPTWINQGTASSCQFRPIGPVIGYGFNRAGTKACTNGATTVTFGTPDTIHATDVAFATYATSDDADQILSVIASAATVTATLSADPLSAHSLHLATLRNGCLPDYDIFAAGTHTTVGGAAAEAITISGVLATDIALVQYSATDDTDTISKAVCTADTLTVTMSANPGTTHGLHYCILRPRGSFKPSHYVAYAGTHTTVGGAAAEAITVTGAAATDVAIVNYASTDDTDAIRKAVVTANTLTVTASADPSTTHSFAYALLRAY